MQVKPLSVGLSILVAILASVMAFSYHRGQNSRAGLSEPMDAFADRPKLLTFGMFVTPEPEQNPIDPPERFTGWHTALDVEILPGEEAAEVAVYAVCAGPIRFAGTQNGYGGVLVQECSLENAPATVLYGHVDPDSFRFTAGQHVRAGRQIAVLAPAQSPGSSDTRKHLHLGIHRGSEIEFRGYVQAESDLAEYVDPGPLFE